MKIKELKKLIENVDDETDVVASVSVDDMTYTGHIVSGDIGRMNSFGEVYDLQDFEENSGDSLVFDLYAFYGDEE